MHKFYAHIPLLSWLILWRPRRVAATLERVRRAAIVEHTPNVWQVSLGVLRMVHRLLFRSETVGLCAEHPVRRSWRARLLQYRPIRFPFLVAERAIAPFDLSGMISSPDRLKRHLIGAHHEGKQCTYDLEMLRCSPGALEDLERRVAVVVDGSEPRANWLRDLVVYESYHEDLLVHVRTVLAHGVQLSDEERASADLSFEGFLGWCASQPTTPGGTWRAWRGGTLCLNSNSNPMEKRA